MADQINDDGIYQGAILCARDYRKREDIIFISSQNELCGLVQRKNKFFKVEFQKKVTHPQFTLPFWSDSREPTLTDSFDESKSLIEHYLQIGTDTSTSSE